MKHQLAFSICASFGLHVGGVFLIPWSSGEDMTSECETVAVLEILDAGPSQENIASTPEQPSPPKPAVPAPSLPEPEMVQSLPVPEAPAIRMTPSDIPSAPTPIAEDPGSNPPAQNLAKDFAKSPSQSTAKTSASSRGASGAAITGVRYRERASLSYPSSALRRHIGGKVILLVDIGPDGRATHIAVRQSSGHVDLDRAAIDCARQSTYEPCRVNGVARSSRVEAPFVFNAGSRRQ